MEWIGCNSCEKTRRDFVARTFALIAPVHPVLHQVSCSYETIPTAPKALWNTPKHEFRVQWGESVSSLRKIQCDFVAQNFVLIDPIQYVLKQVSCSYGTIPNAPKYYETYQNISLGSNGVDWVRLLRKILKWVRGTNFSINCTSSPRFAPSFMQLRNETKCTQTLWNVPKYEFMVQWGGLGAFIVKNPDVTSWHELLH